MDIRRGLVAYANGPRDEFVISDAERLGKENWEGTPFCGVKRTRGR